MILSLEEIEGSPPRFVDPKLVPLMQLKLKHGEEEGFCKFLKRSFGCELLHAGKADFWQRRQLAKAVAYLESSSPSEKKAIYHLKQAAGCRPIFGRSRSWLCRNPWLCASCAFRRYAHDRRLFSSPLKSRKWAVDALGSGVFDKESSLFGFIPFSRLDDAAVLRELERIRAYAKSAKPAAWTSGTCVKVRHDGVLLSYRRVELRKLSAKTAEVRMKGLRRLVIRSGFPRRLYNFIPLKWPEAVVAALVQSKLPPKTRRFAYGGSFMERNGGQTKTEHRPVVEGVRSDDADGHGDDAR